MEFNVPSLLYEPPSLDTFKKKYGSMMSKIVYKRFQLVYWRTLLSEAQNHKCCWCGDRMVLERDKSKSATIEHVKCRAHGGEDHPDNFAIACSSCNNKRGTLSVDEFMECIRLGINPKKKLGIYKSDKERYLAKKARRFERLHQDNRLVWG
jgi:5-methylcytosine-specific restriction endonuclease McrA